MSLVEELQRDALNRGVHATDLLQKALVVATKLRLDEFSQWVRQESEGYANISDVPEYRRLSGEPQVFNPYRGYMPLYFADTPSGDHFSTMNFDTPLGQIEHSVERAKSDSFNVTYPTEVEAHLRGQIDFGLQPSLRISVAQVQGILDAVRRVVLDWSLKLELDGITGEGMSFSNQEKDLAHANAVTYNVRNMVQAGGDIQGAQIQLETAGSVIQTTNLQFNALPAFAVDLRESMDDLDLDPDTKRELEAEAQTLESQANSPRPKEGIIRESLGSIRRILEGAGGGLVAGGLLNQLGSLFGG